MARVAIAQIELGHRLAEPPACLFRRGVPQRQASERRPERDRLVVERHFLEAAGFARGVRDELFGHRHQLVVVGVGLIELEHRELGVVLRRHALVPEVPRQLVDPLHAADHEALEVQLRRDSQVEVHVERVVVRHKGPRRRAAGDRLHDRRLDLHEAAAVEERAGSPSRPSCALRTRGGCRGSRSDRGSAGDSGSRRPAVRATSRAAAGGTWPGTRRAAPRCSARRCACGTGAPRRRCDRRNRAA